MGIVESLSKVYIDVAIEKDGFVGDQFWYVVACHDREHAWFMPVGLQTREPRALNKHRSSVVEYWVVSTI